MAKDPRDGTFRRPAEAGTERLDRVLKGFRPELSWRALRDLIARGKVFVAGRAVLDPGAAVPGGAPLELRTGARRAAGAGDSPGPPAALPPERLVHCDPHLVVVDKPPGLDTVRFGDGPPGLDAALFLLLGAPVRLVHRLDRDTSGLLLFARTALAEGRLRHQLRRRQVTRRYLALAHGEVQAGTIRSFLAEDRGDGLRGSVASPGFGKEAVTHVEVVERLAGATLLACRLESGRTHQIRIHLAEQGHMLLGERAYVREHRGPVLPAPRILLHAEALGFLHPDTELPLRFTSPMPADFAAVLAELRARPGG